MVTEHIASADLIARGELSPRACIYYIRAQIDGSLFLCIMRTRARGSLYPRVISAFTYHMCIELQLLLVSHCARPRDRSYI